MIIYIQRKSLETLTKLKNFEKAQLSRVPAALSYQEQNQSKSIPKISTPTLTKNILGDFLGNEHIKNTLPKFLNIFSILGNSASAVANIYNLSDGIKSFSDAFGKFGTKIFLILNGLINSLEYLNKNNFLGAFGHSLDIIIGLFSSHDKTYLNRGNPVGIYTYANTICNMNGKDTFTSFSDHLDHVKEGLLKSYKYTFSKDILKNLKDANKGVLGTLSAILCNLGSLLFHATGLEKEATLTRDGGGFLVDLEQSHIGHLFNGRIFYFLSGLGLVGGTICDLLAKIKPQYKKSLVPLSLAIDGFGRYLLRISHTRNEIGKTKNTTIAA
jgi:hypothetical protein